MDDKCIMENLLLTTKGVCDLYLHGTIESSTANVHQTFDCALNDSLCMQDDIYKKMSAKGWYPMEQAPQEKIAKVKTNSPECKISQYSKKHCHEPNSHGNAFLLKLYFLHAVLYLKTVSFTAF